MAEDTRAWLTKQLTGLICCEADQVVDDATLAKLGADSLDPIELAMSVEDHFRVDVEDDAMGVDTTVAELLALIERKAAAR